MVNRIKRFGRVFSPGFAYNVHLFSSVSTILMPVPYQIAVLAAKHNLYKCPQANNAKLCCKTMLDKTKGNCLPVTALVHHCQSQTELGRLTQTLTHANPPLYS